MRAGARAAVTVMAWGLPLILLALTLAVLISCGGVCLAGPDSGGAAGGTAGFGNVPTSEPEQPPGPAQGMGPLPGPSTWTQAAVGILLPGLIGLGIALALSQSGAGSVVATPSPAAPAAAPAGGSVAGSAASQVPPLHGPAPPTQTDAQGGAATVPAWDRAKAAKAVAAMDEAVRTAPGGMDTREQSGGNAAASGPAGPASGGVFEAVAMGSGTRVLMDRIASRTRRGEEPYPQRDEEEFPSYADSMQGLEGTEGDIERRLSETRRALSQTERSMAKLDASSGGGGSGGTGPGGLETVKGRGSAGLGGEVVGQADEAAKEYLEYLAMRRDLRLREAVFDYRRRRKDPASKEEGKA